MGIKPYTIKSRQHLVDILTNLIYGATPDEEKFLKEMNCAITLRSGYETLEAILAFIADKPPIVWEKEA